MHVQTEEMITEEHIKYEQLEAKFGALLKKASARNLLLLMSILQVYLFLYILKLSSMVLSGL